MKIGLYFAMPAEFNALPGAKDLTPFETVSGVPFYHIAPDIIACVGGISKVNAAMAAEMTVSLPRTLLASASILTPMNSRPEAMARR